jgi:hypothetical protein
MKKDDDEDDAPTYVMEDTNQSLSKEEYDALVSGKDAEENDTSPTEKAGNDQSGEREPKSKDKIAEVGTNAKKRKAAKIISDEQDQSKEKEQGKAAEKTDAKVAKKSKRKTKPVKLTFGDEDEG